MRWCRPCLCLCPYVIRTPGITRDWLEGMILAGKRWVRGCLVTLIDRCRVFVWLL